MNKEELKKLEKFKNEDEKNLINYNVDDFMDIIYQNNLYQFTDQIYDENDMIEVLKRELDNGNWVSVRNMVSGIRDIDVNYFYRDGCGNFNNVENYDINKVIDNIIVYYEDTLQEDYELQ